MDTFEVERRETLTREEAATRLRRIANLLSGAGEEVKFDREGMRFKVAIPERVEWKVEFETGGEENELEIELKW
jgi:amphi-Trp domain-containing protein